MKMNKKVRRARCFISDTLHPWIARNLPSELSQEFKPLLFQAKELLDEYIENRGIFRK